MANILPLNAIVELRIYTSHAAQRGINVLHYLVTSNQNLGVTDEAFVAQASDDFGLIIREAISVSAFFLGVAAQIISPIRRPPVLDNTDAGAGIRAGAPLPPQCAALIRKRTNVADRHGRGRVYLPFLSESDTDANNFLTANYLLALNTVAIQVAAGITATLLGNQAVLNPVVYRRDNDTSILINNFSVSDRVATQRRRSLINRADDPGPFG